ncbi:hypothetical protein SDJN02_12714, partial [Cucurbita argyrosperma subsp. argyrosperma]
MDQFVMQYNRETMAELAQASKNPYSNHPSFKEPSQIKWETWGLHSLEREQNLSVYRMMVEDL